MILSVTGIEFDYSKGLSYVGSNVTEDNYYFFIYCETLSVRGPS